MYRRGRRRLLRAQAAAEAALVLPLLVLLSLGTYDLSRAFSLSSQAESAARSGLRAAINDPGEDIWQAVYYEPTNLNSSSALKWGSAAVGGVEANCTGISASYRCGDPYGCFAPGTNGEPSPAHWTAGVNACFAARLVRCAGGIQSCTTANLQYEKWSDPPCQFGLNPLAFNCARPQFVTCPCPNNQDPTSSNYYGMEVVVTFKFHPDTSFVGKFLTGTGGDIYIRQYVIGYPIYAPLNCCNTPAGASFVGGPP
jgi:hypothetical protein